jgi:cobalt-zinc-cadmium efflux system membrane fusion protein
MIKQLILLTIIGTVVTHPLMAEGGHHHENSHGTAQEEHHDDHIEWTPELLSEFGIETALAGPGIIKRIRKLPGELDFHLDYLAHVTSRYSGVVKNIYKHVGDTVKKGEVLAVLESNDSLTNYQVKAPLSGVVFEKHLTIGESVPDSTEIFKIADPSHIWVNFHAYSDIASSAKIGSPITIQNENGDQLSTTIDFVSPMLSKSTRTRKARASIRTKNSQWSSGQFVTVLFPLETIKGDIVIPKTALQKMDDKWVVFVKEGEDIEPHSVTIGAEDTHNVVIKKGLKNGEFIVTKGSFILKAEMQKESFGDGHNH